MASGKLSNQLVSSDFVNEQSVEIDNVTINANSNLDIDTETTTYSAYRAVKDGYTPLGIGGISLQNASSSGSNSSNCIPTGWRVFNNGHIFLRIKNSGASNAKIVIRLRIVWVRNR